MNIEMTEGPRGQVPALQKDRRRLFVSAVEHDDWREAARLAMAPMPSDATVQQQIGWMARRRLCKEAETKDTWPPWD